MTTTPETPKKGSDAGTVVLILAVLGGLFVLSNDGMRTKVFAAVKEFFQDDKKVPPPRTEPEPDLLVGTWQGRLSSGADEVLTFEPLGAFQEGVMSRGVFVNGKQTEGWTGKYKHSRRNPLLGPEDGRQIRMKWTDPAWGEKEQFVVLKSVSAQTLVIKGIYDKKVVEYRRTR